MRILRQRIGDHGDGAHAVVLRGRGKPQRIAHTRRAAYFIGAQAPLVTQGIGRRDKITRRVVAKRASAIPRHRYRCQFPSLVP